MRRALGKEAEIGLPLRHPARPSGRGPAIATGMTAEFLKGKSAAIRKMPCNRMPTAISTSAPERWPSGRRRSPAKGVYVKSVSRVRIPSSPPFQCLSGHVDPPNSPLLHQPASVRVLSSALRRDMAVTHVDALRQGDAEVASFPSRGGAGLWRASRQKAPRCRNRQIEGVSSISQRRKSEACIKGGGPVVDGIGENCVRANRSLGDRFDRVEQQSFAKPQTGIGLIATEPTNQHSRHSRIARQAAL